MSEAPASLVDAIARDVELGTLRGVAESARERVKAHRDVLRKLGVRVPDDGWTVPDVATTGDAEIDTAAFRAAFYIAHANYLAEHTEYHLAAKARRKAREQRAAQGLARFMPDTGRYSLDVLRNANARGRAGT